jgi:hypothetical protein
MIINPSQSLPGTDQKVSKLKSVVTAGVGCTRLGRFRHRLDPVPELDAGERELSREE